MPTDTSCILQPLDFSYISPLRAYYCQILNELSILDESAPVKKQKFIKCFHEACHGRLTTTQIQGNWQAASLSPLNRHKSLKNPIFCPPFTSAQRLLETRSKSVHLMREALPGSPLTYKNVFRVSRINLSLQDGLLQLYTRLQNLKENSRQSSQSKDSYVRLKHLNLSNCWFLVGRIKKRYQSTQIHNLGISGNQNGMEPGK